MLAQRIRTLRVYISLEGLDPVMGFVTLSTHIAILMLYDLIESRPMGSGPQAAQFTHTLCVEHKQQSLDTVADLADVLATMGEHSQVSTHLNTVQQLSLLTRSTSYILWS